MWSARQFSTGNRSATQRAFLDDYRPNETYYLPEDTRQRLLETVARPTPNVRPGPMHAGSTTGCD